MATRDTDTRETLKWLDFALLRSRPQNLALARNCVRQLVGVAQADEQRDARRRPREALIRAEEGRAEELAPARRRFA
jgi:hypothetical protein